jgi:hypothetical protein
MYTVRLLLVTEQCGKVTRYSSLVTQLSVLYLCVSTIAQPVKKMTASVIETVKKKVTNCNGLRLVFYINPQRIIMQ